MVNFFSNQKLRTDLRFPVQPQFTELTGDSEVKLMQTYGSTIVSTAGNAARTFDRYINLLSYDHGSSDSLSGLLVESDHEHAMLSVLRTDEKGVSREFVNIGGRPIIDFSRGLDDVEYDRIVPTRRSLPSSAKDGETAMVIFDDVYGMNSVYEYSAKGEAGWTYSANSFNHGVNVISDGLNYSNRCGAFVDGTDAPNAKTVAEGKAISLIPLHSEVDGYTRFDFSEIVDREGGFYSLHADGTTLSMATVSSTDTSFNPMSGICEYSFTPYGVVDDMESLSSLDATDGMMYMVRDCSGSDYANDSVFRYVKRDDEWRICKASQVDAGSMSVASMYAPSISMDGYSESADMDGR